MHFETNKNKLEKIVYAFHLKRVGSTDLDSLIQLSQETFRQAYWSPKTAVNLVQYIAENLNEEVLACELMDEGNQFYFLYQKNTLIGYSKLRAGENPPELENCRAIELQRLYLLRPYWGQGGGSFLLQQLMTQAKDQGNEWMWLLVWFENRAGIRFYERHGFSCFRKAPFQFGQEVTMDWLMKTSLD
ncbi:MAG: GNAT family N-acetyltransferase [Bacteroidota bacterium]